MRVPLALVGFALALAPISALAGGNEAAAEALFLEAQRLVKEHKYTEACSKFAESNRLDRAAGTLIHLGDCYEKNKQTASAWVTYKAAASAAQALGRADWQKLATQRSDALEPKLAKLTLEVSEPVDKIEVTNDGVPFSQASWGTPLPVDIGPHVIEASAPGHKPFKASVTVMEDGRKVDVVIPKLEALSVPVVAEAPKEQKSAPAPISPIHDRQDGSGQRRVGFVVAGVGAAGLAVGAVTGVMAMIKNDVSKDKCPAEGACSNREGVDANDSAKSLGLVSTIAFTAGAALVIGGAVTIFTAPKRASRDTASRVRIGPTATADGAGIFVTGTF